MTSKPRKRRLQSASPRINPGVAAQRRSTAEGTTPEVERELIKDFCEDYPKRPFANLTD